MVYKVGSDWAVMRDFFFSWFMTKEDPKQSAQLQRLSRLFKLCMKKIKISSLAKANNKGADQPMDLKT